jgi:hypothetical protein
VLECLLPANELKEVFCPPGATDAEFGQGVLNLIEESINLVRLMKVLLPNSVRLIRIDCSTYPFREAGDFLGELGLAELVDPSEEEGEAEEYEQWTLPFQADVLKELSDLAFVFGVQRNRPDLVVVGALRLNGRFLEYMRETEKLGHTFAIRGLMRDIDRCRWVPPLLSGGLLRRYFGQGEKMRMNVYDQFDNPRPVTFKATYDLLKMADVFDTAKTAHLTEFGWDAIGDPPYKTIHGLSLHSSGPAERELACLISADDLRDALDCRDLENSAEEQFAPAAMALLDDALHCMRKILGLQKHHLRLVRLTTFIEPYIDEGDQIELSFHLPPVLLFGKDLVKELEKTDSLTVEDPEGYYNDCLEEVELWYRNITLKLPESVMQELETYRQYFNLSPDKFHFVVTVLLSVNRRMRWELGEQRKAFGEDWLNEMVAVRGLETDISKYEAEFGPIRIARVVDEPKTIKAKKVWTEDAKNRPDRDVPTFFESGCYPRH